MRRLSPQSWSHEFNSCAPKLFRGRACNATDSELGRAPSGSRRNRLSWTPRLAQEAVGVCVGALFVDPSEVPILSRIERLAGAPRRTPQALEVLEVLFVNGPDLAYLDAKKPLPQEQAADVGVRGPEHGSGFGH
jgi:hypothetical protein